MSIKTNSPDLEEALELLARKTSEAYSDDGLVTIVFSGSGEYKAVRINGFLEDIDKETLEKAILSAVIRSKEKQSKDFLGVITKEIEKEVERIREREEDTGVTIENVS